MFRLQDERQTERFIGMYRELLNWTKEHDVDIQVCTDYRNKSVTITFTSEDGSFRDITFSEEEFNTRSTEDVFSILQFNYEKLKGPVERIWLEKARRM